LLLEFLVGGWNLTCLTIDQLLGTRIREPTLFIPNVSKKHLSLMGQDTWYLEIILIEQSPIVTAHPAIYWQKAAHGGKTAQVTVRADKAWAVAHADLVYMQPDW
jgi:hypothetical protein